MLYIGAEKVEFRFPLLLFKTTRLKRSRQIKNSSLDSHTSNWGLWIKGNPVSVPPQAAAAAAAAAAASLLFSACKGLEAERLERKAA